MDNYKEIVTKAIIGKGKKTFTERKTIELEKKPSTILGCWIINHNFQGSRDDDTVVINGKYDVNIWYSYDNDTKTDVYKTTDNYQEHVNIRTTDKDIENEEIIIRSLKQPICSNVDIDNNKVIYTVDKELGIELIGDTKVKIAVSPEEDPYEEIIEETNNQNLENQDKQIDQEVKEDFINEDTL